MVDLAVLAEELGAVETECERRQLLRAEPASRLRFECRVDEFIKAGGGCRCRTLAVDTVLSAQAIGA